MVFGPLSREGPPPREPGRRCGCLHHGSGSARTHRIQGRSAPHGARRKPAPPLVASNGSRRLKEETVTQKGLDRAGPIQGHRAADGDLGLQEHLLPLFNELWPGISRQPSGINMSELLRSRGLGREATDDQRRRTELAGERAA